MADDTPLDRFYQRYTQAELTPNGPRELVAPFAPHKHDLAVGNLGRHPVTLCLLFLQKVFAKFGRWEWNQDEAQTNLWIRDRYPQLARGEEERTHLKPALITQRGNIRSRGINGRRETPRIAANTRLILTSALMYCPMQISCVAKDGLEAEELASIVFGHFKAEENTLKPWGFHSVTDHDLGSEGPFLQNAEIDMVEVPVSFVIEFGWTWGRGPDGPDLMSISHLDVQDP